MVQTGVRESLSGPGSKQYDFWPDCQKIGKMDFGQCIEVLRVPVIEHLFWCDHYGLTETLSVDRDIASTAGGKNILVYAGIDMKLHAGSPFAGFADRGVLG